MDEEKVNNENIEIPETPEIPESPETPSKPTVTNSILNSIKKLLGIMEVCKDFDTDIIMHINTVFMTLNQLGVGPERTYRIDDENNVWSEFLNEDVNFEAVKSYIHLKVKLLFDPPLSTAVIEAIKSSILELEWRLNVQAESEKEESK